MRVIGGCRHTTIRSLARRLPLLLAVVASTAAAQRTAAPTPPAGDTLPTTAAGAAVVFSGDTLFHLFGNLGPFTAAARATAVAQRMASVAPAVADGDSIVVTERELHSELSVGDVVVMTVLDADAQPVGAARPALALRYAAQMRTAMLASQERVSAKALLIGLAFALLATGALVALLWLLSVTFPKLYARIETLSRVSLPALRVQNFEILSAGRLSAMLDGTARVLRVVLTILLFYIYVPLVLSFFPWTAPLSRRIVGLALRPFAVAGTNFVEYLPNLFYLAAGVIIVRYLLTLMHMLSGAVESGAITFRNFYPEWAEPTYKIVRVLVFAFAATALYPFLPGASSDAFKGVSLFIGVLFSLGSSAAVGNMVAGIVLTYTRAFQIGDRVKIGETVGDVTEKTLLVTRLRTIKNVAVTIPNGAVLGGQMVNYTTLAASRGLILHTAVTIGYDVPWKQVHDLLIDAAKRTEHIMPKPVPFVFQTSLDDFYVSYEINAFTDRADLMASIYSELHQNIQESFNESGVEITSPHFGALRDGNEIAIPPQYRAPGYHAPSFRLKVAPAAAGATPDATPDATPEATPK